MKTLEAKYITVNRKLQRKINVQKRMNRSCQGVSYGTEFARRTAGIIYKGVKGSDKGFFYLKPSAKKFVDDLLLAGVARTTLTSWLEKFHGFTGTLLFSDKLVESKLAA